MNGLSNINLTALIVFLVSNCSVGSGKGEFHGCLYNPECPGEKYEVPFESCTEENENYHLTPSFFSAQVLDGGKILIRIQKTGYWLTETDGLLLIIPQYEKISEQLDDVDFIDVYIPPYEQLNELPESKRFEASYFMNAECSGSRASFSSGTGNLRLYELYRPDSSNENIKGSFDILFKDPRPHEPEEKPATLILKGEFEFKFSRGVPAQYFP